MDYVGGILTRALGLGAVAVRRKPSIYEPQGPKRSEDGGLREMNEEFVSPALVSERGSQPSEPGQPDRRRAEKDAAPPFAPRGAAPVNSAPPTEPRSGHREMEHRQPAAPLPAQGPREVGSQPILQPRQAESSIAADVHEKEAHRDTRETVVRERVVERNHVRSEINAKTLVEVQRWERQAPVAPIRESVRQAPAKPEPPEIHISIGRIEVRATVGAPAPAPSRRPKEPLLGLDDYLKSRNGVNR